MRKETEVDDFNADITCMRKEHVKELEARLRPKPQIQMMTPLEEKE
jgi:hypothetical protein